MLDYSLNFIVGFTFYFHWLWGFSGASTWHMRPQLGHMEHVVNTCEAPLQVKLVCSFAYTLEDLERAHKLLTRIVYSCQMGVAGAQQHPSPNFIVLVPVMAVKIPLLVLLCLQQVSLCPLKQVLDMQDKVPCLIMAARLDHHIQW